MKFGCLRFALGVVGMTYGCLATAAPPPPGGGPVKECRYRSIEVLATLPAELLKALQRIKPGAIADQDEQMNETDVRQPHLPDMRFRGGLLADKLALIWLDVSGFTLNREMLLFEREGSHWQQSHATDERVNQIWSDAISRTCQ